MSDIQRCKKGHEEVTWRGVKGDRCWVCDESTADPVPEKSVSDPAS